MLDSLLAQTFEDFRVFVVDDQSTDRSLDILNDYSKKDKRINVYIRDREPKGAQTCRNIGFDLTIGAKFVVFFDNDDLVAPYCLEQRVRFMELHQELDYAIFPVLLYSNLQHQPISILFVIYLLMPFLKITICVIIYNFMAKYMPKSLAILNGRREKRST